MSWATMSKAERREAVQRGAAEGCSASKLARQYDTAIGAITALAEREGIAFTDSPGRANGKVGGVAGACSALQMRREPDDGGEAAPMPPPRPGTHASGDEGAVRRPIAEQPSGQQAAPARRPHAGGTWTPERLQRAELLYREGHSASKIAAELGGGITRSAVLGQAHRSNWGGRLTRTGQPRSRKVNPERPERLALPAPRREPKAPPAPRLRRAGPALPRDHLEAPTSLGIALLDIRDDQCHFPDGGFGEPARTFCGHRAWVRPVAGKDKLAPWCEYHARLCYQPIALRTPRADAA